MNFKEIVEVAGTISDMCKDYYNQDYQKTVFLTEKQAEDKVAKAISVLSEKYPGKDVKKAAVLFAATPECEPKRIFDNDNKMHEFYNIPAKVAALIK